MLVEFLIQVPGVFAIALRWNYRIRTGLDDNLQNTIGVIGLVSGHIFCPDGFQETARLSAVVSLTSGQAEVYEATTRLRETMNFGG